MSLPTEEEANRGALMDPQQFEANEASIKGLRRALRGYRSGNPADPEGGDWVPSGTADAEALQRSLERDERLAHQHDPRPLHERLTAYDKAKLWQRIQAREARIAYGMPNDEQMQTPNSRNIDLVTGHEEKNIHDILGWKYDLRLMDPWNTDPNFLNPDRLRPTEPSRADFKQYRERYEQIAWKDELEKELAELDDERYQRFCALKAAEWSKAGIMRELGFTDGLYEAAMARLRQLKAETNGDVEPMRGVDESDADRGAVDRLPHNFTMKDLERYLAQVGMSQRKLETHAGLPHSALYQVKIGRRQLKPEERLKILDVLAPQAVDTPESEEGGDDGDLDPA